MRPYPDPDQDPARLADTRTIEHLDQLYSYLADPSRDVRGITALALFCVDLYVQVDLKDTILLFVSSAALSHPDSVTILLRSYILVPSIITYLAEITNPLWEDDPDLIASPTRVTW